MIHSTAKVSEEVNKNFHCRNTTVQLSAPLHLPWVPQYIMIQTDRWTDRQQCDASSQSYCMQQYDRLKCDWFLHGHKMLWSPDEKLHIRKIDVEFDMFCWCSHSPGSRWDIYHHPSLPLSLYLQRSTCMRFVQQPVTLYCRWHCYCQQKLSILALFYFFSPELTVI